MTKDDNSDKDSSVTEEELREYAKDLSKGLFNSDNTSDFDERGLASGDEKLLDKTDAELFPDELEEYTEEEKKPRLIVDNESSSNKSDS